MISPATKPAISSPVPIRTPRMSVSNIVKGKRASPYRLLIHGVDGVGKSTFGADAPEPVFIGTEDGTDHIDTSRFERPDGGPLESFTDLLDAVAALTLDAGGYKTAVVDSLDWAEPMLWRSVCEKEGVTSIEEVGGGFGKGYTAAIDLWRSLLAALERLQRAQHMNVILIAHSLIKKFANPQGEDFDRYILKLNEKAAGLIREWCKGVYFANYETFAVKDKAKRVRGVSTGARLLYTQRTAAYDAKDRYSLPETIPLSWAAFEAGAKAAQPGDPKVLLEEIQRKSAGLSPGELEKVNASLARSGTDAVKLSQINDYVNARIAEQATTQTPTQPKEG